MPFLPSVSRLERERGDHKQSIKDFVAASPLMRAQLWLGIVAASITDLGIHG
jgi:hypothetical protein